MTDREKELRAYFQLENGVEYPPILLDQLERDREANETLWRFRRRVMWFSLPAGIALGLLFVWISSQLGGR